MFRALIGCLAALCLAACDGADRSSKGPTEDAGGGPPQVARDAGGGAVLPPPLVLEAGGPCQTNADCKGSAAVCLTELSVPGNAGASLSFPGGYCTASCAMASECPDGAECGVKKLVDTLRPLLMTMGTTLPDLAYPSQCLDRCQARSSCREGYACTTLLDAAGLGAQLPAAASFLLSKYCLPAMQPMPAPLDAGISEDAGAQDAGAQDAGAQDAGPGLPDGALLDSGATPDASGPDASGPDPAAPFADAAVLDASSIEHDAGGDASTRG